MSTNDDRALFWDAPPPPPRQAQPGELLFQFHVPATHKFWRVELRDHGEYSFETPFTQKPL